MESYNKALITVSLAFIVAIVSIELVIAGFLGQHIEWIVEVFSDEVFSDEVSTNLDRKLELRLRVAFGSFLGFAFIFWVFAFILFKSILGVKRDEGKTNLQSGRNHDELISSINDCAMAIKDCAESCEKVSNQIDRLCDLVASNNPVHNNNEQSTDNCSHGTTVNTVCKGKESSNSVSVNVDLDSNKDHTGSNLGTGAIGRNCPNNLRSN